MTRNEERWTDLHTKPSVDLNLSLVVLPYDTELDDAFWNLDYVKSLFVHGILGQEVG